MKVGDKIRRKSWITDNYITVEWFGMDVVAGVDRAGEKCLYSDGNWEPYVECKVFRVATEWRTPKDGEQYFNAYAPSCVMTASRSSHPVEERNVIVEVRPL